ncbi:hypothetical protein [Posidoniimonas corsicana]|uniref:hypothetical protein n=1 Tax=Posidoniimonas corsicana TaxID=1938618 RepID=UPI0018D45915|nr:hypothetical protein [Posidoniimonas corsicana]
MQANKKLRIACVEIESIRPVGETFSEGFRIDLIEVVECGRRPRRWALELAATSLLCRRDFSAACREHLSILPYLRRPQAGKPWAGIVNAALAMECCA